MLTSVIHKSNHFINRCSKPYTPTILNNGIKALSSLSFKHLYTNVQNKSFAISEKNGPSYRMISARIENDEIVFKPGEFEEAMHVGFFQIKAPSNVDLELGRTFARTFTSIPRYNQFGVLDVVNGFLQSDIAQTVRFTLERDNWNLINKIDQQPNYPLAIQTLGHQIHSIGIIVLKNILRKFDLPQDLWFQATGGSSEGEGSHFLLFNCYDPKHSAKAEGVGAHKDWGHLTVLDAPEPGLEAKIDGIWRHLHVENNNLIINFGYPLEKLLIGVKASEHRVATQKEKMRTSTVAFIDPRVGPYRKGIKAPTKVGYVYDWDWLNRRLINGIPTTSFFQDLNDQLYGKKTT